MPPSPFELQATSEDDLTTRTLGQLAHDQGRLRRLIRRFEGPHGIDQEPVAMLFFCRLAENFFREAIARVRPGDGACYEARWNRILGLPTGLRWARATSGRWVQPAKWQARHMEAMAQTVQADREALLEQLKGIQQVFNTEPDVVLAWGDRLLLVEVKVLSGLGDQQLNRIALIGSHLT